MEKEVVAVSDETKEPVSRGESVFRLATLDDVEAISAIESDIFPKAADRLGPRQLKRLLTEGHGEIYLDEVDGRIAGFAIVLFREGSRVARGYSIAVLPEVRRTGVATDFFAWGEQRVLEAGCDEVHFEVHTTNTRARHLYEELGYRVIEEMPDYFGPGDHAVRMSKTLG
jgi:ribosomal protein S18 acetylase RimI-like enzyme